MKDSTLDLELLRQLPRLSNRITGIYYLRREGSLRYIGQGRILSRIVGHTRGAGRPEFGSPIEFDSWSFLEMDLAKAKALEPGLIMRFRPPENLAHNLDPQMTQGIEADPEMTQALEDLLTHDRSRS